jgi:hypothetical protein
MSEEDMDRTVSSNPFVYDQLKTLGVSSGVRLLSKVEILRNRTKAASSVPLASGQDQGIPSWGNEGRAVRGADVIPLLSPLAGRGYWVYVYYDYTDCAACHRDYFWDWRFLGLIAGIEDHQPSALPILNEHVVSELSRAGKLVSLNFELHQVWNRAKHYDNIYESSTGYELAKQGSATIREHPEDKCCEDRLRDFFGPGPKLPGCPGLPERVNNAGACGSLKPLKNGPN